MAIANDTYVEGSDTTLTSHAPTGPNAGTSWVSIAGSATVRAATDDIIDSNGSSGNKIRMTNDLGIQHRVQVDIWFGSGVGGFVFSGVAGRQDVLGTGSYEFTYSWFTGEWILEDGVTSTTLAESYGTDTTVRTMRLDLLTSDQRGFVDNVQKVALTTDTNNTLVNGGIVMGNFTGTAGWTFMDNYQSQTLPATSLPIDSRRQRFQSLIVR